MRTTVAFCTLILLVTMTACGVEPTLSSPTAPPPTLSTPIAAPPVATAAPSPAPTAVAVLPAWLRPTQALGAYRLSLFLKAVGEQTDGHLGEGVIVDFTGAFQDGKAVEYRQLGATTLEHVIMADGQMYVRGPVPNLGLDSPAWYQIDPALLPNADPAYDLATVLSRLLGALDLRNLEPDGVQTIDGQMCDLYRGNEYVAQPALSRFLKRSPELQFDHPVPQSLRRGDIIDLFSHISIAICPDGYLHRAEVRFGVQTGDDETNWQLYLDITEPNRPASVAAPSDYIVFQASAGAPAPAAPLSATAAAEVAGLVERGRAQLATGDAHAAIATLSQALARDPGSTDAYVARAEAYLALERYAHAIDDATRAIALAPERAEAFRQRAQARHKTDDLRGAIADYTEAIRLNGQDKLAYLGRGLVYDEGLKRWEEADDDYTHALAIDPNDISLYRRRGDVRRHLGDEKGVIADYTQVIKDTPNDPQLYRWRAYSYMGVGDYQAALGDLNIAARLDPGNADTFCMRGRAYLHLKDYAAVVRDSEEGMRLNPISRCAYRHRGDARRAQGDKAGALEDYRHYLDLLAQCGCEDGLENVVRKNIRELESEQ
jgi:tetratricopeptide (TPR) repeat protein